MFSLRWPAALLAVALGAVPASFAAAPATDSPPTAAEARQAIERSLPFLERGGKAWMYGLGECTACHHTVFVWSFNEVKARGFRVDEKELEKWNARAVRYASSGAWVGTPTGDPGPGLLGWTWRSQQQLEAEKAPASVVDAMRGVLPRMFTGREEFLAEVKKAVPAEELDRHQDKILSMAKGTSGNSVDHNDLVLLLLGRQRGRAEDRQTWEKAAQLISRAQKQDGSWHPLPQFTGLNRPALEGKQVSTMWAVLALNSLDPLPEAVARSRDRAVAWLKDAQPGVSTESLFLTMLLARQLGQKDRAEELLKTLLQEQKADGGWSWRRKHTESDALTTGQTLYALSIVGGNNESIQKAWRFLLSTQVAEGQTAVPQEDKPRPYWGRLVQPADGSWLTPSAAANDKPRGEVLENIFNYWGTCWAVIGLARTLPDVPK